MNRASVELAALRGADATNSMTPVNVGDLDDAHARDSPASDGSRPGADNEALGDRRNDTCI